MMRFVYIFILLSFPSIVTANVCYTYTYYIQNSGQFISSSSELTIGDLVKRNPRKCIANEKGVYNHGDRISYKVVEPFVIQASERYAVDANLIRSVIQVESGYSPMALSNKGAKGLMQLMDATAEKYNVLDPYNPEENITAGTHHLATLLDRFEGNTVLALAAYNAGANAVEKYNGIPPYEETQKYVKSVMTFYDLANSTKEK